MKRRSTSGVVRQHKKAGCVPKVRAATLQKQEDRKRVLAFAIAAGVAGVSISEVKAYLGRAHETCLQHLRALKAEGLLECSHNSGRTCRWGPIGTWAHHQGSRDREAQRREQRAYERKDDPLVTDPIVQTRVPAHLVPPLLNIPVPSVWAYAARYRHE
jgi:hypothetical protein